MIEQYGVLPFRVDPRGELEILLITSRETGRWIIPKGNLISGLSPRATAAREAHEEAGVAGEIGESPIGSYRYLKRRGENEVVPAQVEVFAMRVTRQDEDWPERGERRLKWLVQEDAAEAVEEPELRALILSYRPEDG